MPDTPRPRLVARLRHVDQHRAARLMIGWTTGDKLAVDVVLEEVMDDPEGTAALMFCLLEYATELGEYVAPNFADQLRTNLLRYEAQQ